MPAEDSTAGQAPQRTAEWRECVVAVVLPPLPPSLLFRAYDEPVGLTTLLDWVLRRVRSCTDAGAQVVALVGEAESDRAVRALSAGGLFAIAKSSGLGVWGDIEALVRRAGVRSVLLLDPAAALLPSTLLGRLLHIHVERGHDATGLVGLPCQGPALVESTLIGPLSEIAGVPEDPDVLLDRLGSGFRLGPTGRRARSERLTLVTPQEQDAWSWPYSVRLNTREDVEILRLVLEAASPRDGALLDDDYLTRWTQMAGHHRERARASSVPRGGGAALPPRPRVLFVQSPSAFSGVEQVLALLAEGISRSPAAPVDCSVAIGYEGVLNDRLAAAGVDTHIAGRDFTAGSFDDASYVRRLLDDVQPALLHVHALAGVPLCCAAEERGIPLVQHVHVASEPSLHQLFDQLSHASRIVAVSAFVKQRVVRLGFHPDGVSVIPNGTTIGSVRAIDDGTRACMRRALEVPDGSVALLLPARFARNKRHDIALQTLDMLHKRGCQAYAIFAGEVYPAHRSWFQLIQKQVDARGLRSYVRFLSFVRDMASLYSAADILLMPSEDDPLPMTIMEAMAAHVAVVAADSGGIPEMIDDGVSGLLVRAGDAQGFAVAVDRVVADAELRNRLLAAAALRCRGEFSLDRFVGRMLQLYREVLPSSIA